MRSTDQLVYVNEETPYIYNLQSQGFAVLFDGTSQRQFYPSIGGYTYINGVRIGDPEQQADFYYIACSERFGRGGSVLTGYRNQQFTLGQWRGTNFVSNDYAADSELFRSTRMSATTERTTDGYFIRNFPTPSSGRFIVAWGTNGQHPPHSHYWYSFSALIEINDTDTSTPTSTPSPSPITSPTPPPATPAPHNENAHDTPATRPEITILMDGQPLIFDQPPIMQNNRVMVPVRAIFEAFGAQVSWNSQTRQATATHTNPQRIIILTIGSYDAYIDGVRHRLDSPAVIIQGRTLVPLRFISEAFEADVHWSSSARRVTITSRAAYSDEGYDYVWEDAEEVPPLPSPTPTQPPITTPMPPSPQPTLPPSPAPTVPPTTSTANNTVTVSVNFPQAGTATIAGQTSMNVPVGEWASIQAQANPGFEFSHWEVVSGNLNLTGIHYRQTNFFMPAGNVHIRAVFVAVQTNSVNVNVSVNNPQVGQAWIDLASLVSPNQWITVHALATVHGYEFSHWEVISGGISFTNQGGTRVEGWATFLMPTNDVSVRAVFIPSQTFSVTVSVNNPQAGTAWANFTTDIPTGFNVAIDAQANPGFVFSHWEVVSGNAVLQPGLDNWMTFIMPESNVHVRAVFVSL